ncbi:MAG: winged helix-turn-helix transcriptional regulator [Thermoplasmata archaeon]
MSEYVHRIRRYLSSSPGSHLRLIQRDLDIKLGTLRYHLRRMERGGAVTTFTLGRLRGYFVTGQVDHSLKPYLMLLRNGRPRQIVGFLLKEGEATHGRLAKELRIPPSTLSLYLGMLMRGDILRKRESGRKNVYSLQDTTLSTEALEIVKSSLKDRFVDAALEIYEENGLEGFEDD